MLVVFWWLALARRQFTGRVCWWELSRSVNVPGFGEKEAFGSRVLAGTWSPQCFGGSRWRRRFSGIVCWWATSHSVLVAGFGEKDVPDRLRW